MAADAGKPGRTDRAGAPQALRRGVDAPLRALLPQGAVPGKNIRRSAEWLFEPYWNGERMLAFVEDGEVALVDYMGDPVPDLPHVADAVAAAMDCRQAVIDMVWAKSWHPAAPEAERQPLVVVVDLLEIDDQPLLDVPLLERRRLLESVVAEDEGIRVTPAARAPVESSINAWRAQGFAAILAKHANSRYLSGERNAEWVRISIRHVRPTGLAAMLLGSRGGSEPTIKP